MKKRQEHNKNILIFGAYSHENRGDHAMLIGLVEHLKRIAPDARLIVYSTNPEKIRHFLKVKTVWSPEVYFLLSQKLLTPSIINIFWFKQIIILMKGFWFILNFLIFRTIGRCLIGNNACLGFYKQLLGAKALVLSGGGYLNSIWSLNELYAKALIIFAAKLARVLIVLRSQTIGPFTNRLDRIIAKLVFNRVTLIGVRDTAKSENCLRELGVKRLPVVFTGDDSLLLSKINKTLLEEIIDREKIPLDKELIGVNLRNPGSYGGGVCQESPTDLFVSLMDQIVAHDNDRRHLLFLPISYNEDDDDRISAEKICSCMKYSDRTTVVTNHYGPVALKGLVGLVHTAIGVSYHFLLFALSNDIPAIGLFLDEYYRHKNMELFELYNLRSYCLPLKGTGSINKVVYLTNNLLLSGDNMRGELQEKNLQIEEMTRSAQQLFANYLGLSPIHINQ